MGVAVLNPQDCLKIPSSTQPLIFPPPKMKVLKPPPNYKPKANRSSRNHPNRPKRSPLRPQNGANLTPPASPPTIKSPVNKLVSGQVKILKRGELLTDTVADRASDAVKKGNREKPDLGPTSRVAPSPKPVPTEGVAVLYAGSSMFLPSPPPSSLPLPAFFTKKSVNDATSNLRRILRLDVP